MKKDDPWVEAIRKPAVPNADNEWLGAAGPIGRVNEVNGRGAEEVVGFVPTRHELIQLVKYWANLAIDLEYLSFYSATYGSSWNRKTMFGWRRVNRIASVLGDDEVKKVVDDIYEEFGKDQDPRVWRVFLNGTPKERKAVQAEIQRLIEANATGREQS